MFCSNHTCVHNSLFCVYVVDSAIDFISPHILFFQKLERALSLVGVSVSAWYEELPRSLRTANIPRGPGLARTLSQFYRATGRCLACDVVCVGRLCDSCARDLPSATVRE